MVLYGRYASPFVRALMTPRHSGMVRRTRPGISRFRVRVFDAPRNDAQGYKLPLEQPNDLGKQNLPLRKHKFRGFVFPFAIARRKRVLRAQAMFEDEPRI
jgi:hypothetical protein